MRPISHRCWAKFDLETVLNRTEMHVELHCLTDQSSELRKLTDEYDLIQLALETVEKKTTTIAFQPPHFKVLDLDAECLALQNRIRAAK